jgi:hypothetical protein
MLDPQDGNVPINEFAEVHVFSLSPNKWPNSCESVLVKNPFVYHVWVQPALIFRFIVPAGLPPEVGLVGISSLPHVPTGRLSVSSLMQYTPEHRFVVRAKLAAMVLALFALFQALIASPKAVSTSVPCSAGGT